MSRKLWILGLVLILGLGACSSMKTPRPGQSPFVSAYFGTNSKARFDLDKTAQSTVDDILKASNWPILDAVDYEPEDVVLVLTDKRGEVYSFVRTETQAFVSVTFDRAFVPTHYTVGTIVLDELVAYLMTLRTNSGVGLDPFTPAGYYLGTLSGYTGAKLTMVDATVEETLRSFLAINQWVKTSSVTLQGAKPDIILADDKGTLYLFAAGVGKTMVGVDTDVTESGMTFYSAPPEVIRQLKHYFTFLPIVEKNNVNLANLRFSSFVLGDGSALAKESFEALTLAQSTALKGFLKLTGRISAGDQRLYEIPIDFTLYDSTGVLFRFARIGDRVLIGADYKPTSYGLTYYWLTLDETNPMMQALTYLEFLSTQGVPPDTSITGVEFTQFYVGNFTNFTTTKLRTMTETVKKDINGFVLRDYWRTTQYVEDLPTATEFILADAVGTLFFFRTFAGVPLFKVEEGPWISLPVTAYQQTLDYLKTIR